MITDFAQKLLQELTKNLPELSHFLPKRELHIALQSTLNRLDLVTREEFDAQTAVLLRTRAKLEQLEKTVAAWELEQKNS